VKKIIIILPIIALIFSCVSTKNFSPHAPNIFFGRIQLRLENYAARSGVYTRGIYVVLTNKETEKTVTLPLDNDGFFETAELNEGKYILQNLFVDEDAIPRTTAFRIPLDAEMSIENGQVNVYGDLTITIDQAGKGKIEINTNIEDMKRLFLSKAPDGFWLDKHWRLVTKK
jgi:hypothetical protein